MLDMNRNNAVTQGATAASSAGPDAAARPAGPRRQERAASPEAGRRAERSHRRRSPRELAWWAAAAVAVVLGALSLFTPYTRGILGEQEGSRRLVETSCAAPVIAVGNGGSRALDSDGNWRSPEAPCQRSAAFRIGLGALLFVGAGGLAVRARRSAAPAEGGRHVRS